MTFAAFLSTAFVVIEYVIKIVAIGVVPENRRPSSSTAWLLLILFLPVVGLPLFLLLGSATINRRRHRIQGEANQLLDEGLADRPTIPAGCEPPPGIGSLLHLNRRLTSLPCVTGTYVALYDDYAESFAAMAAAVDEAQRYVDVEIYITAWDDTSAVLFAALSRAASRGVEVRLLLDHIGSRKYPGFKHLGRRLDDAGIRWRYMLPIDLLRGRFRRVDLRNHRKLLVVDGDVAFMGSQNLIDSSYLMPANVRAGRHWHDAMICVRGEIVRPIEAVFVVDWYTETGEQLLAERTEAIPSAVPVGGPGNAFQLVPSGPGFTTEPNLRLFTSLIHAAQERISICSPYFVPDESLLAAVTTAGYRGIDIELFVSEQADQFMVDHAQSSYYRALLEAGVRIRRYPSPAVLHTKFLVIDGRVGVIGSSNMDMRSFGLNYEISLLTFGGDAVTAIDELADRYRTQCRELTLAEWNERPYLQRYLDSVFRLTSALQ